MFFKATTNNTQRTIFMCNSNDGHCCGDTIELDADSFWDDCEGIDYWFHVRSPQDLSFWDYFKYWWKWRQRSFLDITLSREDLEELRNVITKELEKKV